MIDLLLKCLQDFVLSLCGRDFVYTHLYDSGSSLIYSFMDH